MAKKKAGAATPAAPRQTLATAAEAGLPLTESAYPEVLEALRGLPVPRAYVLPDGSWRFSKAYALGAVGGREEELVVVENDSLTIIYPDNGR